MSIFIALTMLVDNMSKVNITGPIGDTIAATQQHVHVDWGDRSTYRYIPFCLFLFTCYHRTENLKKDGSIALWFGNG